MEIADIIVVNKADRPEASQTVRALQTIRGSMESGHHQAAEQDTEMQSFVDDWDVPILKTSALDGSGMTELLKSIEQHKVYLEDSGSWELLHARHARGEVESWLRRHLWRLAMEHVDRDVYEHAVRQVISRDKDPSTAAQVLLELILEKTRDG